MYLLIDSNIYLSLYECGGFRNNHLSEILKYVKQKDFELILPEQVKDEVFRDRLTIIGNQLDDFKNKFPNPQLSVPNSISEFDDMKRFCDNYKKCHNLLCQIIKKSEEHKANNGFPADTLIKEAFDNAVNIKSSSGIMSYAELRDMRGNPPRKSRTRSLGDAIIWESLLNACKKGKNIAIISNDGDFVKNNKINAFLKNEWSEKKKSEIFGYGSFDAFICEHRPSNGLELENKEPTDELQERVRQLINVLENSPSYYETHQIIENFKNIDDITVTESVMVLKIMLKNSQVADIIKDDDISRFVDKLINIAGENSLDDDMLRALKKK